MRRTRLFRLFVGTAGAISLLFSGSAPAIARDARSSPLLAQSPAAHAFVLKLADMMLDAAGGKLTIQNVHDAMTVTAGLAPAQIAAALNQLRLAPNVLKSAIAGMDTQAMINAMITHTYMNQGRDAAYAQIDTLRGIFGADAVTDALDDGKFALLKPNNTGNLPNIQPRAGGELYDG